MDEWEGMAWEDLPPEKRYRYRCWMCCIDSVGPAGGHGCPYCGFYLLIVLGKNLPERSAAATM